ncbi:MAG TPA: DUF3667 domain-containing protein [Vicinamibacterales bacterium]
MRGGVTIPPRMSTSVVDPPSNCANCGAALQGTYCAYCGQKVAPLNPAFGEFLHELFHEIAHVDGKIVATLRLLITKPGFLSLEYFEGRRARYVAPIRLYLLLSVLCFGATAIAPDTGFRLSCRSCPAEIRAEREREMGEALPHWAPRAMFVLVPVFAGLVALAARRSGRHYPEHLYFAMHVHSAWFFAGIVWAAAGFLTLPYVHLATGLLLALYCGTYFSRAFRRVYHTGLIRAILSTAAISVTYVVCVLAALLAILLPVALRR